MRFALAVSLGGWKSQTPQLTLSQKATVQRHLCPTSPSDFLPWKPTAPGCLLVPWGCLTAGFCLCSHEVSVWLASFSVSTQMYPGSGLKFVLGRCLWYVFSGQCRSCWFKPSEMTGLRATLRSHVGGDCRTADRQNLPSLIRQYCIWFSPRHKCREWAASYNKDSLGHTLMEIWVLTWRST